MARTTRQQSLTELGRTYYERCKLILAEVEAADALAAQVKLEPRGRLRISAPKTLGANGLVPVLMQYQANFPQVEVDLVLTDRIVDLVEEGFEAAFRVGTLEVSGLVARKLTPYRLAAAASPEYLARHGIPSKPSDLVSHNCLVYTQRSRNSDRSWQFLHHGESHTVEVSCRFRANNVNALVAAALEGAGVVLAAEDALSPFMRNGHLVRVLPNYEPPSRAMHLLYSPDRHQTPKLRQFIHAAVSYLKPNAAT